MRGWGPKQISMIMSNHRDKDFSTKTSFPYKCLTMILLNMWALAMWVLNFFFG